MGKVIKYSAGDFEYVFYVEINAAKTFKEFAEHEKHYKLSKEVLKEIHDLCKQAAGVTVIPELPVWEETKD